MSANQLDNNALAQLSEVKGSLDSIMKLLHANHESTHQRIDDLRHSMEGRFEGVEIRLKTVEENERATAIKSAGIGALSGALVGSLIEFLKHASR